MPGDVESMNKFFQAIKTTEHNRDVEDIDFDMRAPYIPMDGKQDLGLLPPTSNVLFNLSTEINPGSVAPLLFTILSELVTRGFSVAELITKAYCWICVCKLQAVGRLPGG